MNHRSRMTHLAPAMTIVALVAGCGTETPTMPLEVTAHRASAAHEPRFSEWSEPVNLGPVVNSPSADIEVSISKDGLTLVFASDRPGGFGLQDLWATRRASEADPWGPPENLGPDINTAFDDRAPSLSRDGHWLYFSSDRPGFGGVDLYVTRRRDKGSLDFEPPVNLGSVVNSAQNEGLPYIHNNEHDGTFLYFNSNRPGGPGNNDIYASTLQSDGTFGTPVLVAELSSPLRDAKVAIRRDGLELFITSDRVGTLGAFDVWVATRAAASDPWGTPVNLGPIINAMDEGRIDLSFDATTLFVTGTRPGGLGRQDIWVSTRTRLRGAE